MSPIDPAAETQGVATVGARQVILEDEVLWPNLIACPFPPRVSAPLIWIAGVLLSKAGAFTPTSEKPKASC